MATPVMAFAQIVAECEAAGLNPSNGERIALEIAKTFSVHDDEVAILRLEKQNLVFVYPVKLHNVGTIPTNTSTSVAARTVTTKRAEAMNNFAQTKHATVFEAVDLANKPKMIGEKQEHAVIQKLMTVPVMGSEGVLGVIQVSRKGTNAPTAGPDFSPADLQRLVAISAAIAKCFK